LATETSTRRAPKLARLHPLTAWILVAISVGILTATTLWGLETAAHHRVRVIKLYTGCVLGWLAATPLLLLDLLRAPKSHRPGR